MKAKEYVFNPKVLNTTYTTPTTMATKTKKIGTVPIRIGKDVIAELKKLGSMHESYTDVLRRVLDMHKLKKGRATPKEKEIASKV